MTKPAESESGVIIRHNLADRLTHWSNAALWIFLLFTGLALFDGEHAPLGAGYSRLVRDLVGGGGALLKLHLGAGFLYFFQQGFIFLARNKMQRLHRHMGIALKPHAA